MPNSKFSLSAVLASNRYFTAERRGEIDALACYVSYRVQRDLYDLCRENGWFRDLPWAEFVMLMRASKSARSAAICVIFDTLSSFFTSEHYNFDAAGVSMIYGGEGEDPNDDRISCAQLFSPDEGSAFIESFLLLTEIAHYKRHLSQGKDYSWQQYLNKLDQNRTLWNEVLMGYRDALVRLNFKPAWEARRLAELVKAVTEARDGHE